MPDNPYVCGMYVEDPYFYGRQELCLSLTTSHNRCVYLMGMRRVGKTSLLRRLAALLRPHALYCDLMLAASDADDSHEKALVQRLQIELRRLARISEPVGEIRHLWEVNQEDLCTWLEELSWGLEERNVILTLLWDEAEMLRHLSKPTLMRLRAILQSCSSLRIIVGASKGLASINDRWRDEDVSPFLFGFRTQYISVLRPDEAEDLIHQRGQVYVTPETITSIQMLTGNHPFLLQSLCSRLYKDNRLRMPVHQDVMMLAVDPQIGNAFRDDIARLSPSEQRILVILAKGLSTARDLAAASAMPIEVVTRFLCGLFELGFVQQNDNDQWKIGNAILGEWLHMNPSVHPPSLTDRASLEVVDPELQQLEMNRVSLRQQAERLQSRSESTRPNTSQSLDTSELATVYQRLQEVDQQIIQRSNITPATQTFNFYGSIADSLTIGGLTNIGGRNPAMGDTINISGNTGSTINVKAQLDHVVQQIGSLPVTNEDARQELADLIKQLSLLLENTPAGQESEAEKLTKRVEAAVGEVAKSQPDREVVQFNLDSLKQAAENIAKVLPTVLPVAMEIAERIRTMLP